jgi:hypothetical protein
MRGIYPLLIFLFLLSCDDYDRNEEGHILSVTLDPNLTEDTNGYYHLTLDQSNWQTLHRLSGTVTKDGSPAENVKFYWESNLFWVLGDTLGYIVLRGLTDDLEYVSYDTSYIIGFSGMEVPTINPASYSNSEGEFNQMIAPVNIMTGDTMVVMISYFDSYSDASGDTSLAIVLE